MTGILALAAAVLLQIVYTAVCFITRSKKTKLQGILRFSALGALSALLIVGVFQWGFRWIFLFALLALLSAISVVRMIRGKAKPFRPGRAVISGVLGVLLFAITILPAILFPQYRPIEATGPYAVATQNATYADESRAEPYSKAGERREVNVTFWYPDTTSGTFPLIVFSHGFCGVRTSNQSTFRELASHGYAVMSVDHPYQSLFTVDDLGRRTFIDRGYISEYMALGNNHADNLKTFQKWMDVRVGDLSFAVDSALKGKGGVYDRIDRSKIGAFGHSLGGAAAAGLARARGDIGAVVNLDAPMMCELTGIADGRLTLNPAPYPAPILQLYSEFLYKNAIEGNDPEYVENRLAAATAPASYEAYFRGTQHLSLTDFALFSPILVRALDGGREATADPREVIQTMNRVILEFFDSTLKGEGVFQCAGEY